MNESVVYTGDCIAGMRALGRERVDLAFADPPFNIGYDYDRYRDRLKPGEYLDWSREWMRAARDVLKPAGTFWLAIGDDYAAELAVVAKDVGFHLRSWVIWHYEFGTHCQTKWGRDHTHLLHFLKDPKRGTFNADAVRIPSKRQAVYGDKRADPRGRVPGDVWSFPRVCGTFKERRGWHTCQMPEAVLGRVILACSNPGELVLDPFAGSGTTLAAAKRLGRRAIGFEISPEYARKANERINSVEVAA